MTMMRIFNPQGVKGSQLHLLVVLWVAALALGAVLWVEVAC